jgi:hypothetical protein
MKRKISLGGRELDAEEIEFQPDLELGGEKWSEYTLLDGTRLRVKAVVTSVLRIEGEYAPNGDPLYIVNSAPVIASSSPPQIRRPQ